MKPQKTECENHVQERLDVIYKKWKDNPQWNIHEFLENLKPCSRTLIRVSHMNLVVLHEGLHFWNAKGFFAYAIPPENTRFVKFDEELSLWAYKAPVGGLFGDLLLMKEVDGFELSSKIIEILEKSILLFKGIPDKGKEKDKYEEYLDRTASLEEEYFDLMLDDQATEPLMFKALWGAYTHIKETAKVD